MKRIVVLASLCLLVAGCTGPDPSPSATTGEPSASATPTVTVTATATPTPSESPSPLPTLEAWPWDIAELKGIAIGDTFKAIAATTGDAVNPCQASDDAFFATGDGWVLGVRGQGKDILEEGGYIAQTATALALVATGSGLTGPVGPLGLQLGASESTVADAMPDADVSEVSGVTLYTQTMPDDTVLTVEVTDGSVTRIAVSTAPLTDGGYQPVC